MVPTIEARVQVVVTVLDFFVREGEESAQDCGGARLVLVKPLVSRYEKSRDNPRPVGRNMGRPAVDEARSLPDHCKTLS